MQTPLTMAEDTVVVKERLCLVMSSRLCKLAKSALRPFQVKPVKNRKDNPLDTLHVHETDHGPRPPTHFDETPLNHIRRPQCPPEGAWALEECQQLWQVPQQPHDELRIRVPPPTREDLSMRDGRRLTRRPINGLGVRLHRGVIPSSGPAQQIAELLDPPALMRHARIDRLEGGGQARTAIARTAIGHDQLPMTSYQAPPIELMEQAFPRPLALARTADEGQ